MCYYDTPIIPTFGQREFVPFFKNLFALFRYLLGVYVSQLATRYQPVTAKKCKVPPSHTGRVCIIYMYDCTYVLYTVCRIKVLQVMFRSSRLFAAGLCLTSVLPLKGVCNKIFDSNFLFLSMHDFQDPDKRVNKSVICKRTVWGKKWKKVQF